MFEIRARPHASHALRARGARGHDRQRAGLWRSGGRAAVAAAAITGNPQGTFDRGAGPHRRDLRVAAYRAGERNGRVDRGHRRRSHPARRRPHARRCAASGDRRQRRARPAQLGDQRAWLQRLGREQDGRPHRRPQRLHAAVLRRLLVVAGSGARGHRSHRDHPRRRRHAVGRQRRERRHQHHHQAGRFDNGRARAGRRRLRHDRRRPALRRTCRRERALPRLRQVPPAGVDAARRRHGHA